MFTLFDDGVREDLPTFDLDETPVFLHGSTLAVAAQHEVDGDTFIEVVVDESSDLLRTPRLIAEGAVDMPYGRLHLYTAAWLDDDELTIPPGSYGLQVFGSPEEEPAFVTVVMTRGTLQ